MAATRPDIELQPTVNVKTTKALQTGCVHIEQIELVGDDLFVTNVKYIQRGIDENLAILCVVMLPTY